MSEKKPLTEIVDDLIEVWHDAPDDVMGPKSEGERHVELHHFLGMSWDEYANWMGPRSDGFPARLEPYVRAQHARWVAVPDRTAALRDVETLLAGATNTFWGGDGLELLIDGQWRAAPALAALIVDRVLGAEQDGGAASS